MTPDKAKPNSKKEEFIPFDKFVKFDEKLTKEQAIEKLSLFHKASPKAVLDSFYNLEHFDSEDGFVVFKKSVNSSRSCISMDCLDKDGKFISSSLINEYTGQPMEHCG